MLSNSVPSIKIAKESLLSCRTTGVNGVGMFARQQVVAHPVCCALTALTVGRLRALSLQRLRMWQVHSGRVALGLRGAVYVGHR